MAQAVAYAFEKASLLAMETIGKRIRQIGRARDPYGLKRLGFVDTDLAKINAGILGALARAGQIAPAELYAASAKDYNALQYVFDAKGTQWMPFAQNKRLTDSVQTTSEALLRTFSNYSRTTGFVDDKGVWQPMARFYREILDKAVRAVTGGEMDYNKAMRKSIAAMADSELSFGVNKDGSLVVSYPSGYSRRLDSSIQNAFAGAQQRLSMQQAAIAGQQIGADGYEVSWHAGARPSHVDFAGKQYSMRDYERIAVPLLTDYNCYHRSWPIVLGVTVPAHTPEELRRLNAADARPREYAGKTYTAYEAQQVMRRMELSIRRQKSRAAAFSASGDEDAARVAKAAATVKTRQYRQFCKAVGLDEDPTRITLLGLKPEQIQKWLPRGGIARTAQETAAMNLPKKAKAPDTILQATYAKKELFVGVIPKGASLVNSVILAGKGTSTGLRDAPRLSATYGGKPLHWQKKTGIIVAAHFTYEVHWYELDQVQYEMKLKKHPRERR